jgi:AraC-like DNA-binding protein
MAMPLNLALETHTPDDMISEAGLAGLAGTLLSLLDLAASEIGRDAGKTRTILRRASSILRIELERRGGNSERGGTLGELAGWQVSRVRAYIDEHLSERIQVKDLSAVARRSTAHFCRSFKRTLGETPHTYITRRRLDQAQRLMLTGDAPLSEIALLCGFSDQSHFCNFFRKAAGQSPAAWRRERRESRGIVPLVHPVADGGEIAARVAF